MCWSVCSVGIEKQPVLPSLTLLCSPLCRAKRIADWKPSWTQSKNQCSSEARSKRDEAKWDFLPQTVTEEGCRTPYKRELPFCVMLTAAHRIHFFWPLSKVVPAAGWWGASYKFLSLSKKYGWCCQLLLLLEHRGFSLENQNLCN